MRCIVVTLLPFLLNLLAAEVFSPPNDNHWAPLPNLSPTSPEIEPLFNTIVDINDPDFWAFDQEVNEDWRMDDRDEAVWPSIPPLSNVMSKMPVEIDPIKLSANKWTFPPKPRTFPPKQLSTRPLEYFGPKPYTKFLQPPDSPKILASPDGSNVYFLPSKPRRQFVNLRRPNDERLRGQPRPINSGLLPLSGFGPSLPFRLMTRPFTWPRHSATTIKKWFDRFPSYESMDQSLLDDIDMDERPDIFRPSWPRGPAFEPPRFIGGGGPRPFTFLPSKRPLPPPPPQYWRDMTRDRFVPQTPPFTRFIPSGRRRMPPASSPMLPTSNRFFQPPPPPKFIQDQQQRRVMIPMRPSQQPLRLSSSWSPSPSTASARPSPLPSSPPRLNLDSDVGKRDGSLLLESGPPSRKVDKLIG